MLAAVAHGGEAFAGGFDIPDNGTQALGRGAAFVAKADDPTAIYHNPAGLARQRGTNFLFNGNLLLHSFEFARIGIFPDDPQLADRPWGQRPFPVVKDEGGPSLVPFLAVATDFGYFDRVTFGAGIFAPPMIGNRSYSPLVDGFPSAARYDSVLPGSSLLFPTASVAVRATPWLDFGLSAHFVLASFNQTSVWYSDLGKEVCKAAEDFTCDSPSTLTASGSSFGATFGAMARPLPSFGLGLSFRTPINITGVGQLTPQAPSAGADQKFEAGAAVLQSQLPWMVRVGGRYIGMDADFEVYDLELDVVYEAWGVAQAQGPIVRAPSLGSITELETMIMHGYQNTFGLRGGGAYNIDTGDGILSLRAGSYFDSPATSFATTRLDYDTLTKIAGTIGAGFKIGAFDVNLAYAAVASVPRLVGTGIGVIRPINPLKNGQTIDADDQPLAAINEGSFRGFTHIVSFGVTMSIDTFFGPPRPIHYGNDYEPNYVSEESAKPVIERKKVEQETIRKDTTDEPTKSEKKVPSDDEKKSERKPAPDDEKKPVPPDDEKKPEKKSPLPPDDAPDEPKKHEKPPEVKKPPPRERDPEKSPTKRREWWEDTE